MTAGRAWYVVALCMVAYIFSFIDRQILSLLIEPIKADLMLSDTQFGLLQGLAFALFYATMGIPIASLADRHSRPLIITIGVASWSIATMICGLARSFPQLFLARLGVGAGEAALSPATYSLIGDMFPREKLARALAVYSTGSFLGSGIAFLVGSSVIQLAALLPDHLLSDLSLKPWQLVFIVVGLPGILLSLLIFATVREPGERAKQSASVPTLAQVLRFLSTNRGIFIGHMLGFSAMAMSLFVLLGWMPAYMLRTFHIDAVEVGLRLGVVAMVGGVGGVLASGWLVDRFVTRGRHDGPLIVGIMGAVGTMIAMLCLAGVNSLDGATAVLCLAIFFASWPMPPSTAIMQVAPPRAMRSRVSAIFLFLNSFLGLTLGSWLVGLLNDRLFHDPAAVGKSMVIVVVGASCIAITMLWTACKPYARFVAAIEE